MQSTTPIVVSRVPFFRLLRLLLPCKCCCIRVKRNWIVLEVFEFFELRPGS